MAERKSICSMLGKSPLVAETRDSSARPKVVLNGVQIGEARDDLISSGLSFKGQWNNLALGSICFKHVRPQILQSTDNGPRVGDVCVRFMPVTSQDGAHSSIVDLYNSNVATGSALIAQKLISGYAGLDELHVPCIPVHVLVSEWNKSLYRFHETIDCGEGEVLGADLAKRRECVLTNVTELAYKNVPVASDHLWFAVHCVVSKPHLVKQVLQLVGSISSTAGRVCHTGVVQATTVPRDVRVESGIKLFLIAKPVRSAGEKVKVLGDHSGVALGLVWATDEGELHDHLRNGENCHYLHLGTEYGNNFRCNAFCDWRHYNRAAFDRMIEMGHEVASRLREDSALAGNTGDSARATIHT